MSLLGDNDAGVDGDDALLRRLIDDDNMIVFDGNKQNYRPTSGSYARDDDGVSGYLDLTLQSLELGPADVVDKGDGDLCYAHNVAGVRAKHDAADVVRQPDEPTVHRVDPAHALITVPDEMGQQGVSPLRRQARQGRRGLGVRPADCEAPFRRRGRHSGPLSDQVRTPTTVATTPRDTHDAALTPGRKATQTAPSPNRWLRRSSPARTPSPVTHTPTTSTSTHHPTRSPAKRPNRSPRIEAPAPTVPIGQRRGLLRVRRP